MVATDHLHIEVEVATEQEQIGTLVLLPFMGFLHLIAFSKFAWKEDLSRGGVRPRLRGLVINGKAEKLLAP